jgi:large subunit ribosomal protein L22
MEVRAVAKYVGISPQKLRLAAGLVRGKKADEAVAMLRLSPSPAARALAKVVKSASANAENNYQMAISDLKVVKVFVDQGATLKRIRAQARGRVSPILRHTSHITVVVDVEE